jgi:hypothetical protein
VEGFLLSQKGQRQSATVDGDVNIFNVSMTGTYVRYAVTSRKMFEANYDHLFRMESYVL